MKNLEELIEHHTHRITDDKHNEWEVIEVSDLKDIITQAVHQALDEAERKLIEEKKVQNLALSDSVFDAKESFKDKMKEVRHELKEKY